MIRVEIEKFERDHDGMVYRFILEAVERPLIEHVLGRTCGNQLMAARILGVNRNTLRSKIKKLGIKPDTYKNHG